MKIRFQSEGRLLPGQKPRYSGVLNAYSTIIRTEGVLGLWTGFGPAVARNSLVNATELATYDTAKEVGRCLRAISSRPVVALLAFHGPSLLRYPPGRLR